MAEPKLAACPTRLWRVGRSPDPLNFSEIDPVDAAMNSGNRFDVPGGGVLYAASKAQGAFAETLSRFRPTASMRALPMESSEHFMAVGAIPADWRTRREIAEFRLNDPLPFLDVDAPETHTFLTAAMASELESLDVENLDVATVRSGNRHLTRAIAQWAYTATDEHGDFLFSGIRYGSKLGAFECWAIFAGSELGVAQARAIEKGNAALNEIARIFDLTIH